MGHTHTPKRTLIEEISKNQKDAKTTTQS